jgi:hypothetical protein
VPRYLHKRKPYIPDAVEDFLIQASADPLTTSVWGAPGRPFISALGKEIQELLDMVLTPVAKRTGLPKRLQLGGFDSKTNKVKYYGQKADVPVFESTPEQLDEMLTTGMLDVEQPPKGAVEAIRKRIAAEFDAAANDPRNRTLAVRESKSPMRELLDQPEHKPTIRRRK